MMRTWVAASIGSGAQFSEARSSVAPALLPFGFLGIKRHKPLVMVDALVASF